jgi:NAD(P)-dependent dehydrogenase (short-subunit alcohol dehydrogenase family)
MPEALIWGASGGIGSALVHKLKAEGWRVFAAARRESGIPANADMTFPFNALQPATVAEVASVIAAETSGLDLVIYAAGGVKAAPLEKLEPDAWRLIMAANLDGAFLAARSSLNLMRDDGHLMIIGAHVGKITLPRMGAYAAAKAGLETFITVLQKEHRRKRITIVRPSAVDTPMWANVPFNPPQQALSPESVAQSILDHHTSGGSGELDL